MASLPIVPHYQHDLTDKAVARAEFLAERLASEPKLQSSRRLFAHLIPDHLTQAQSLHLDDLSAIPLIDKVYEPSFLEDRARLRAGDGDLIATCTPHDQTYEIYCQEQLGLGTVRFLHPSSRPGPLHVANACWTDREVRHILTREVVEGRLHYVHPFMGCFAVWALAALLQKSADKPLGVVAPTPGLTRFVNDKYWFARVVEQMFGSGSVPRTEHAFNLTTLAKLCLEMSSDSHDVVIKLPDSSGGRGNLVLKADRIRGRSLASLRRDLRQRVKNFEWSYGGHLLVSSWQKEVLHAPSAQLWLPPESEGLPIVEGLFVQRVEGVEGVFAGSRPAMFPDDLASELCQQAWLLGRLFQRLGYLGRCSFDMLTTGSDLAHSHTCFIECNGRWGGTSLPMTLANRLFGDWQRQPYAARKCAVQGLDATSFKALLEHFAADLFDVRTGRGNLVFFNPGGLRTRSAADVLILADSWEAAHHATQEFPKRLEEFVASTAR